MNKILFSAVLLTVFFVKMVSAQTYSINGKVTDNKTVFPGVNILVKELSKGASTNEFGNFTIGGISKGSYTLNITFIGYLSKDIKVEVKDKNITLSDIILKEDYLLLEQVVLSATRKYKNNRLSRSTSVISILYFDTSNPFVIIIH